MTIVVKENLRTAEETLERLEQIIKRGRLNRRHYAQIVGGAREPDAPCGGSNACMIGAAWLAAGVGYEMRDDVDSRVGTVFEVHLPGTLQGAREDFLKERGELARALTALNQAADEKIDEAESERVYLALYDSPDEIEQLFESGWAGSLDTSDLHEEMGAVVKRARELLEAPAGVN